MILHGDELIPDPGDMTTLAVPIEAPAADVLAAATTRRMLLGVNARAEGGRRVARSGAGEAGEAAAARTSPATYYRPELDSGRGR